MRPGQGRLSVAVVVIVVISLAIVRVGRADEGPDGPLDPATAAQAFRTEPGARVELVAAEPLVVSPVAMAFDDRGRLFVAENRGYPTGPGEGAEPVGRIALLEDTDGDGRMDRRSDFATNLTFPNGVLPWKGGLIVTCAPDVHFLRDTDGDGKADERTVLFNGFATTGSTQLRVSHPTLSIDNWIYLTSGLTGGSIVSPKHPERPAVVLSRTDFRFRPDGNLWEAADGGSQFGMTFDDAGHRFICYNRVQVQHVVIDAKDLRRNPHLAFSETVQNCPAETVAEPLKGHGAASRIFPISRNVTTADSHAGTFTAACGVFVFRGDGLPEGYLGRVFSCEPTGNLVHVDRLIPKGATFAAVREREKTEFLASSDSWFRPVFLASGPDGALYISDMYRRTIEHPDYLPVEIRKRTDFRGGKTMGRIWRVVHDDAPAETLKTRRLTKLSELSTPALCDLLRSPDGWQRDQAHRMLLERRDAGAVEPLRALIASKTASAAAVVQAVYLLAALDALNDETLRSCLESSEASVRENALRVIATKPEWLKDVLARADDTDPRVRFQAAISLGTFADDPRIAEALAKIAARDGDDKWTRAAVFSAVAGREIAVLDALSRTDRVKTPLNADLLTEFGRLLGASRPEKTRPELVQRILQEKPGFETWEEAALLTGLASSARGSVRGKGSVLAAISGANPALSELVAALKAEALDAREPIDRRKAAVRFLAFADYEEVGETLRRLIDEPGAEALQAEAVRAFGPLRSPKVAETLLSGSRFDAAGPALREEILAALMTQAEHLPGLLSALEVGTIPVGAIDAARRRQLAASLDPEIQRRARTIFGAVQGDRGKVFESLKEVIALKANPENGRTVFRRECASCHRLDRDGTAVGPDLFGVRNQPKEAILLHIIAPDQEVTAGFAAYTVATRDGRILNGLIASESAASVTLRQPLGKEETLLRSEVEEIRAARHSLMPEGLEKTINRQEFADLLAYLKGEGA